MLESWDPAMGALYRELGVIAVALARGDGRLDEKRAAELDTVLKRAAGGEKTL
jgi:hypothetical protein